VRRPAALGALALAAGLALTGCSTGSAPAAPAPVWYEPWSWGVHEDHHTTVIQQNHTTVIQQPAPAPQRPAQPAPAPKAPAPAPAPQKATGGLSLSKAPTSTTGRK
jgi:hypothetical protein